MRHAQRHTRAHTDTEGEGAAALTRPVLTPHSVSSCTLPMTTRLPSSRSLHTSPRPATTSTSSTATLLPPCSRAVSHSALAMGCDELDSALQIAVQMRCSGTNWLNSCHSVTAILPASKHKHVIE
jgi:hypothetical protein